MPKSTLLTTSEATLKTLFANGMTYSVPPYQRDYSWREEHWEDLWLDLMELVADKDGQHYMGALVLRPIGREQFEVIDGQQRLVTLSLIVLAAIKLLHEFESQGVDPKDNIERADLLRGSFIGTKDPGSLKYQSKLSLNRNDDKFYQGTVIQLADPHSPNRLGESNRLIWQAFQYYKEKIEVSFAASKSGADLASFISDVVGLRLLFIRVQVDDDTAAYNVFETLNARELDLTASDLLKNYMMAIVARRGKADLEHVLFQWETIANTIGIKSIPEFLRHHLNSKQSYVRQERLFKTIKSGVTSPEKVFSLLDELERDAIWYQALRDPNDAQWTGLEDSQEHVRVLNLFEVKQYKPLILAAARRLPMTDLTRILGFCVAISFRYNVICDRNTNELEKSYNDVAIDINNSTLQNASAVLNALKSVYVPDDEFRDSFSRKSLPSSGRSKKVVRYILCALERQLGNREVHDEASPATIEYILPENLTPDWATNFTDETHVRYISRLGNYALLDAASNRNIGQSKYSDKQQVYAISEYKITKKVEAPEWTPSTIDRRQKEMAGWASGIWRLS